MSFIFLKHERKKSYFKWSDNQPSNSQIKGTKLYREGQAGSPQGLAGPCYGPDSTNHAEASTRSVMEEASRHVPSGVTSRCPYGGTELKVASARSSAFCREASPAASVTAAFSLSICASCAKTGNRPSELDPHPGRYRTSGYAHLFRTSRGPGDCARGPCPSGTTAFDPLSAEHANVTQNRMIGVTPIEGCGGGNGEERGGQQQEGDRRKLRLMIWDLPPCYSPL